MLKRLTQKKKLKVGHAGTLDPRATGLLIVCTGKKTKTIDQLQGQDKVYEGSFQFGATTPTYDTESEEDQTFSTEEIDLESLRQMSQKFVGNLQQAPPAHSAVRINGERAYKLARKGETVEMKKREVRIDEFTIHSFENKLASFEVKCSKGTYIRSLAHDFGATMNSGAYLKTLRRTQIGDFHVDDALSVEQFEYLIKQMS